MKYRKKPVIIEAWQWKGSGTFAESPLWVKDYMLDDKLVEPQTNGTLTIPTLEGVMTANQNDWVIQGIKGELYPCKPDIFEATYEKV